MSFFTIFTFIKDFLSSVKTVKDLTIDNQPKAITNNSTVINNYKNNDKKEEEKPLNDLQLNLKKLFNIHSIEDNLIAEFLKNSVDKDIHIPFSKYSELDYVFDILNDTHLDKISKVFGINKGWLFGREDLYPYINYYKNVHSFISFVIKKRKTEEISAFALRLSDFDYQDKTKHQPLYIVLRSPILDLYDKTIYKYYHISTNWKWGYWRSRYQAKSIFRLFETPNYYLNIDGKTLTEEELSLISNRNNCPDKILRKKVRNTWYPYDYSTKSNENVNALELEEVDKIIKYIEDEGYKKHLGKTIDKILV